MEWTGDVATAKGKTLCGAPSPTCPCSRRLRPQPVRFLLSPLGLGAADGQALGGNHHAFVQSHAVSAACLTCTTIAHLLA